MKLWVHRGLAVAFATVVASSAQAREFDVEIIVETVEDLYAYEELGQIDQDAVELLSGYLMRPIDLNRADRNILFELPGVTYNLAGNIVAHRAANGDFVSVEGLKDVEGMQDVIFIQLQPFIEVSKKVVREPGVLESLGASGFARFGSQRRDGYLAGDDPLVRDINDYVEREHGPQAYLQLQSDAYTYFSVGTLLSYRRSLDIEWEATLFGDPVYASDGPENRVRLDGIYATSSYAGVNVIVGSYVAGFGERLTFNTSQRQLPAGWYPNIYVSEDNERGTVRPRDRQFGVAVQYDGLTLTRDVWVDATVFGSLNSIDLYQRDFNYAGEEICAGGASSANDAGYSCAPVWNGSESVDFTDLSEGSDLYFNGSPRNIRIYDYSTSTTGRRSFDYERIRNAYLERLVGGNLTFHYTDALSLGLTSYVADTVFLIDEAGNPNFAASPVTAVLREELGPFGAVGAHLRYVGPRFDIGAEYAYSLAGGGGHGFVARADVDVLSWLEMQAFARAYGATFVNPRANPRSFADKLLGARARNERGLEVRAIMRPASRLRLISSINYNQNPNLVFLTDSGYEVFSRNATVDGIDGPVDLGGPLDDLQLKQNASYGVTTKEQVYGGFEYQNRVVRDLELSEVDYVSGGDSCGVLVDVDRSDCSTGSRFKAELGITSTRIPRVRIYARVSQSWYDAGKTNSSGDYVKDMSRLYRLRISVKPWDGANLIASATYRPTRDASEIEPDAGELEILNSSPQKFFYVEAQQKLGDAWTLRGRFGIQDYDRNDAAGASRDAQRYSLYRIFRLGADYRF